MKGINMQINLCIFNIQYGLPVMTVARVPIGTTPVTGFPVADLSQAHNTSA
jgi:hypothetical protein